MDIILEFTNINKDYIGLLEQAENNLKELDINFKVDYDRLKKSRVWLFKHNEINKKDVKNKDINLKLYLAENYGNGDEVIIIPMDFKTVQKREIDENDISKLVENTDNLSDEEFYEIINNVLKQFSGNIKKENDEMIDEIVDNPDNYPPSLSEDLFMDNRLEEHLHIDEDMYQDIVEHDDESNEDFDEFDDFEYEIRRQRLINNIEDFKQTTKSKPKIRDYVIETLLDFIDDKDIDEYINKIM